MFPTDVNKFGMLCLASNPRLLCPCRFTILQVLMRDWQARLRRNIGIHAEGICKGCAYSLYSSRETIRSARFAIPMRGVEANDVSAM